MFHHMNDPMVVGAAMFASVLAEYYTETSTNADQVEQDLLQIIDAHHEPVVPGEPQESRDYARSFCGMFAGAIRQYQSGERPWYGPSERA